uniref:Candidate secreted effector n=1 Tax=Meloidogyne incognita TaxID=6306 RepID=A0A914KL02_MELIC
MSPTFLFFVCLFSCFNLYCFAPPPTASTSQINEKQINREIVELIKKITEKPSLFYKLVEKEEFVEISSSKMKGRDVKKIFTKIIMDKFPSEKGSDKLWSLIWGKLVEYDKILVMLAGFWNDKCKIDEENKQKVGHKTEENPKVLPKIHKDDRNKEKEHEIDSSLTAIASDEIYDDLYIALQNIKEDHFTPKACKALMVVEPSKNQSNNDSTLKLPSKDEHQKEHDDTKINSSKADVHKIFKSIFDRFNANYRDHRTEKECVHPIKGENIEEHHGLLNAYKIPKNLSIDLKPLVIKEGSQKEHFGKKTPETPCSESYSSKPSPGKGENQGEQDGIHPPSPHPGNIEEENKEDNEWFEVDPHLHLEEFFEEEKKKEEDDDWIEPPNFM